MSEYPYSPRRGMVAISGTVRARAARELRDRILTGELARGSQLDVEAITEEFGTSRTPIREALLELSYEGLVHIAPRSRVTVLGVTTRDVTDSFTLLSVLSGRAAEWAAKRMSLDAVDELRRLNERIRGAGAIGPLELSAMNWQFHRALNHAAQSPRLLNLLKQAVRVVPTRFFEMFPEREDTAYAEHELIVAALSTRNAAEASALAEAHVADAGRRVAAWLNDQHITDLSTVQFPSGSTPD